MPNTFARPRFFLPVLLLAGALVSAWYAERGPPFMDAGAQLTAAARILRGGVFFRDVDAYPFPAPVYTLALAMRLFGEHLSVARALAGVLFCGMLAALYAAALPLLGRERAGLFGVSVLAFKFLGWPAFSAYLYSDFAFCFACAAIALLLHHPFRGPSVRLALAGACTGLALVSKQNVGVYLAASALTLLAVPGALLGIAPAPTRRGREVAVFAAGLALPVGVMAVYFAAHGLLPQMLYSGFVRPLTGYLPTSGVSFSKMLAWWNLGEVRGWASSPYFALDLWVLLIRRQLPFEALYPAYWLAGEVFGRAVYTSVPLILLWALVRRIATWRHGNVSEREARLFALALLCAAVTASVFPRADFFHVISVYPVLLLLLLALGRAGGGARALRVEAACVLMVLGLFGLLAVRERSSHSVSVRLERASFDVTPAEAWLAPLVEAVSHELAQDEPIFVYGNEAHLYFLTGRFFPWPFSQLYPGQEGGDRGAQLARLLDEHSPRLILRGLMRWPGMPPPSRYAPVLHAYIREHYEPDETFFERHGAAHPPPREILTVLRRKEPLPSAEPPRTPSASR